jgi:N-terminal domain of reverse transcriptase
VCRYVFLPTGKELSDTSDRLQKRLAKATEERNRRAIRYLKHLIRKSVYVRLLAVKSLKRVKLTLVQIQ